MFKNKLVSIVVPIYNMEAYIPNAVETLCNQTYSYTEIIFVDDASTDNSLDLCKKYEEMYENLTIISLSENKGAGNARNVGIEIAKGEYLYFPDIDDLCDVRLVDTIMKVLSKKQYDLVVFGYEVFAGDGKYLYQKKYEELELLGNEVREKYHLHMSMEDKLGIQGAPWNKFFKADIIKDNSEVRYPNLRRHQDEVFIMRYVKYVKEVKFIGDILYTYHFNNLNNKIRKFPENYFEIVLALDEYRRQVIVPFNYTNQAVLNRIELMYILSTYNGLELLLANDKTYAEYKKFIKKYIYRRIKEVSLKNLNIYQRIGILLIQKRCDWLSYKWIKFKLYAQKKVPIFFDYVRKRILL